MNLYELAVAYRADADKLADLDLDEQTIADTLESMGGELQEKATNTAMLALNLEASAAAIKEAEARMANRRKALEKRAADIRKWLLTNMQVAGVQKIECPYFKLAVRDNPPAVEVFDEAQVPEAYTRKAVAATLDDSCEVTYDDEMGVQWITITGPRELFKLTQTPDKTAIKDAIKAGEEIAGCRLTVGKRLDVK